MPARTLDQIVQEQLGLKDMTIARLLCQLEDARAQLELAQRELSDLKTAQESD
jgi:hypothetical protein